MKLKLYTIILIIFWTNIFTGYFWEQYGNTLIYRSIGIISTLIMIFGFFWPTKWRIFELKINKYLRTLR